MFTYLYNALALFPLKSWSNGIRVMANWFYDVSNLSWLYMYSTLSNGYPIQDSKVEEDTTQLEKMSIVHDVIRGVIH